MRKFLLLFLNLILCFILTSCMYEDPSINPQINDNKPNTSIPDSGITLPDNNNNNSNLPVGEKKLYSGKFSAMHTEIELTVFDTKANADMYYKDIKKIYSDLDKSCRTYFDVFYDSDPESATGDRLIKYEKSDVFRINKYKTNVEVSAKTIEMLKFANKMREDTNGYYNPFLGRLIREWKMAIDGLGAEPSIGEMSLYTHIARHSQIKIDGNKVSLYEEPCNCTDKVMKTSSQDDLLIDLGGIAKGYATQKAKEYFDSKGFNNYLLNAGQSNIVAGVNPIDKTYNIGVSFPFAYPNKNYKMSIRDGYVYVDEYKSTVKATLSLDKYFFDINDKVIYIKEKDGPKIVGNLPITSLKLSNKAICTSAPTWQKSETSGELIHHLISPFTGKPENFREQVTLIADDSGMLDAYSTAMFVMPEDVLQQFIIDKNIKCIIVNEGRVVFNNYEA